MNENKIIVIPKDELMAEIESKFRKSMDELSDRLISVSKSSDINDLLSRDDVLKILNISSPTLLSWEKKGLIKSYRKGRRIYYQKEELMESLRKRKF